MDLSPPLSMSSPGKSWRPRGRQLGRQLSPREIWTYGKKNQLAANWPSGRGKVGGNLAVNFPLGKYRLMAKKRVDGQLAGNLATFRPPADFQTPKSSSPPPTNATQGNEFAGIVRNPR